jgi:hypothetical protein
MNMTTLNSRDTRGHEQMSCAEMDEIDTKSDLVLMYS